MADIPFTMTASGAVPRTALESRQATIDLVAEIKPEFAQSLTLPGSPQNSLLDTAVMSKMDIEHAITDHVNSLTPRGANEPFLNDIGYIFGLERGEYARPSVYVRFTGTVGLMIPKDFLISDSVHQYRTAYAEVIGSDGFAVVYCIATTDGRWEIPANTVNQLVTSVYNAATLSATNPGDGFPGAAEEKLSIYRARVISAMQTPCTSLYDKCKGNIQEVISDKRLVSVRQVNYATKVVAGGGDIVKIAKAIFESGLDISRLIGSLQPERNVTVPIILNPDIYRVIFVQAQQATIDLLITWNTNNSAFFSNAAISSLAKPALIDYINSLFIGSDINILSLNEIFRQAIKSVIPPDQISKLNIAVEVNNVVRAPSNELIIIDKESYTFTTANRISITRG